MEHYFKSLFVSLRNNAPNLAIQSISHIYNFFSEDLEENEIDANMVVLFDDSSGLLAFINRAAKDKAFEKSVSKALEVLYVLMHNFPSYLTSHVSAVITSCKFVCDLKITAVVKQKAIQIFNLMLTSPDVSLDVGCVERIYVLANSKLQMKASDTVTSEWAIIFGKLTRQHPTMVKGREDLLRTMINMIPAGNTNLALSEGLLLAINDILHCTEMDDADKEKLYVKLERLSNHECFDKKVASRAALQVFAEHITKFEKLMRPNAVKWNNQLRSWLKLAGENFKAAAKALDTFYLQLTRVFADVDKSTFDELMRCFRKDIEDGRIPSNQRRLSIRGYGYFASIAGTFLTSVEIQSTFLTLLQGLENNYVKEKFPSPESMENLPDYVLTLSYYTKQVNELSAVHISCLQKITVTLIKSFPKLSTYHHGLAIEAFIMNLYAIETSKSCSLEQFLNIVIDQGVMWTCSHYTAKEVEMLSSTNEHHITYKSYLPLWIGVFGIVQSEKQRKYNLEESVCKRILDVFVDTLMKVFFILVNKLNINIKNKSDQVQLTDPGSSFEAVKINDFVIFVNLADFFVDLLEEGNPALFQKWLVKFNTHVIEKTQKYPLISGFYKLLAANLKVCDKLGYFTEARLRQEHVVSCFESLKVFVRDTTLKLQHTSDDLQMSCMLVVLAAPVCLIESVHADYASAFVSVFTVGRNYLPIAKEGVNTLNRWYKSFPKDKTDLLLRKVLPSLDYYLQTRSLSTRVENQNSTSSRKGFRKRQVVVEKETELLNLQKDILKLLAKMNSEICWEFINANSNVSSIAWNKDPSLKVSLAEDNVSIHLDKFLPRLLQLSQYSSDRITRGHACELLHSTITIMLGKYSHVGAVCVDKNILEKVFGAALNLGCDGDTTIRNMYNPLVIHMIHWYSSPKLLGSKETHIILKVLFDKISQGSNAKMCDLSSICIEEFVAWTIKQSKNQKALKINSVNIDEVIDKIRYFSAHPDPAKRLGGALMFNSIYSELREQDFLINKYWLVLLHTFVHSLSTSHFSNKEYLVQVNLALDHLLRVFIQRSGFFNTAARDEDRVAPQNFTGNTLKDVVIFLLKNTASINGDCRKKCLEMFSKIALLVRGKEADIVKVVSSNPIKGKRKFFFDDFEHDLTRNADPFKLDGPEEALKWLSSLLCLLDGHIFAMQRKNIPNYDFESSRLNQLLQIVLKNFEKFESFATLLPNAVITSDLKESYSYYHKHLIEKIYHVTMLQLVNHCSSTSYFNDNLWEFLYKFMFSYYTRDVEEQSNFREMNKKLLIWLEEQMQTGYFELVTKKLSKELQRSYSSNEIVPQSYRQILRSIIYYESPKLKLSLNFVDDFCKQWIQTDSSNMNFLTALSPSYFEYCDLKLQIALQNNFELDLLTNYLCDQRYAKCLNSFIYERYGWLIFKNFSNTITSVVSRSENFETFLSVILTNLNPRYAYDYVDEILKQIGRNLSKFNEETRKNVVSVICKVWGKLAEEFSSNCRDVMRGVNLIESMAFVVGHVDGGEVFEWVLGLLNARYCSTREELFEQINRTVYVLGFVARKGSDSLLKIALQEMKQSNSDLFGLDSSIIATTLLIKASFEAAIFSKSVSILSFGIDMSITAKNNFHDNLDPMYAEFFNGLQLNLQLETLQEIFLMCSGVEYNYVEKMKIGKNLCRMLHCCDYGSFEEFFEENILQLIEDFGDGVDYTRKLISSLLVSALFARVDLDKMEDKNCPITAKACVVKTGRELIKKLFVILVNVCKQPCPKNPEESEIFRLYQCQAYNALISIVCCCKKDNIGFYNKLFYRADASGEDILWRKLVDCTSSFNFSPEVDEIPKKRKVLVGIRTEFHDRSGDPNKKSKYIESQHLFQSSLQEDITRYDFTNVHGRTQPLGDDEMEEKQQKYQEMQIELTEEDINRHECMSSLCGLIKHMAENNLLGDDDAPPQWIKDIKKLLLSDTTHANVKYFLAKMISNTQEFLKVYGKWLMGPIIGIIQSFDEINSFVIDMVVMFLTSWIDVEILPEENEAPSTLVKFLMQHLYSENSEILRYNVTMLGMVVERWKNNLTVPYDLILEKLSVPSKSVIVGVHIVNILLVNDIAPWGIQMKDFSKKMVAVLERREKRIYGSAAETIGLVLKFTEDSDEHAKNLDNVKKLVSKKLKSISDEAILVHCLEAMAKHYPEICDEFSYKLLTIVNGEDNINYLSVCLRVILKCFESLNEKHGIHTVDTESLLSNPSLDIQVVLLEIISKSVDFITAPNMKGIVKSVSKFVQHKNRVCRDTMYTILMSVYKKYCLSDDDLCLDIVGLCRDVLLQGLNENELEIREKLYQFWLRNEQLPSGIDKKVLYVLKEMYKPTNENIYLMYASCMLLGNLKSDLEIPIFEGPLQDCQFTEYELSTYYKDRNQSMMPMFASTFSSQKSENVLRATQTLQFEPTLTNTIATQRATYTETSESFLFRPRPEFKNPNEIDISNRYKIVARRFNRDRNVVSKFHASREIKNAVDRRKTHAEAVKKRENDICVYRKYRDGDLPDIQISLSAVILPLQSLAKHDHQVARLLFSSLFETSLEITARSDAFIENSTAAINFIFNNSMFYNPSLMGTLMDIALSYKDSIKFRPEIISRSCQGSGLISTGCLLLEEYLISMPDDVEPPRKKIKSEIPDEDEDTLHWVKLAELYKAMEDWDVVRSIFLYKMQCPENVIKAIKDESSGYFKNASETYSALIQEDVDLNRKDFYYESFFKCLAELSAWSDLDTSIKSFVSSDASDPWPQLWEDEWNREKLLPHYINAQIRLENYEYLQIKFNEDLRMADRTEYLKNNNSGELAFLGIFDKNFSNCRNFLNIYVTTFLSDWSYINPLFSLLRMQRLMSARSTLDIGFFTECYEKMDIEPDLEVILNEIQCLWERNQEENFVSIMDTETRNLYRKQFVSLFKRRLDELGAFDKFHILDRLQNGFEVNLMEVALNRGSYYVAKKCMKNNHAKIKNKGNAEEYVSWNLLCSMLFHLNSRMFDDDVKKVEINCKALTFLDNCTNNDHLKENRQLLLKASLHRFELTSEIYKISHNNNEVNNVLQEKDFPLGDDLENLGVQSLLTCLETCRKDESKAMLKKVADCFCKLAHYMLAKGKGFEKDFMLYTFRAMKYESEDAIMLFPYLLTIENLLDDEITALFLQQSSDLPTWLYLKWIPQLLAYLDTDKIRAISDIVLRIAKEYPNSIIYAYKIAKERYSFAGDQILLQDVCNELDTVLSNSTVDLMLSALSSVCTPGVMVKTAADQLRKANSVSEEKFRTLGEVILKSLYGKNYDYYSDDCVRGRIFKNVDKHKKAFEEILKGKYDKKKVDDKLQALRRLEDKMEPGTLSHYSPWLANFHPNDYDEEIEIPGQYNGDGRPLLQYHVKLAGFSSEVKVLTSLRRPIKITMLGNNAKEYEFLLKYGEDLRQDQRIEQLFTVMNKILKSDSNCCQRKLNIVTYEVIPLTTNVGIIEWVGETEKLGDFILKSLDSKTTKKLLPELSDGYSNWMRKVSRNKNSSEAELYVYAMLKHDRDQASSNYKSLVQKIPPHLLRSSFRKISMDTESFFALRDDFIKSYAVMCVSNWLLGIGDRHLSNILISMIDGRPIGIDFGHAFGTGTELPVPELVPFRLTPQIANLMQPHYQHGALQESMVHALKALQKRKDVLLAMMDVFIREPTMNWLEHVEEKNEASISWYPQQKISLAKRKLDGANPCLVMAEEIQNRKNDNAALSNKYLEHVKGVPGSDFRAGECETVDDQVKCLLDQAMDPNLLGRMYQGWMPWI